MQQEPLRKLREKVDRAVEILQSKINDFIAQEDLRLSDLEQRSEKAGHRITTSSWSAFRGSSKRDKDSLPKPKTMNTVRKVVPTFTDEDAVIIKAGQEARMSLRATRTKSGRKGRAGKKTAQAKSSSAQPHQVEHGEAHARLNGSASVTSEEGLLRLIARHVAAEVTQQLSGQSSDVHNSGPQEKGPALLMVPLVLSADSWQSIDLEQVKPEELSHLIEQGLMTLRSARQFLNLIAQVEPESVRETLMASLLTETNELVLALLTAKNTVPAKAISLIEKQRECL